MSLVQNPSDKRRQAIDVTANKTLTDVMSGIVQNVITDGVVITLPAAAAGKVVTLRNGGAKINANGPAGATNNASVGFTVTGSVSGLGATGALSCSKASSQVGDEVTLVSGGAVWYVRSAVGSSFAVA